MVQWDVEMIRLSSFMGMDVSIRRKQALKYSYNFWGIYMIHHLGNQKYIQVIHLHDI